MNNTLQPIRAVIFDIGGVFVRTVDWSGRRKWEQHLGLPEGGLSTLVFDSKPAALASIGAGPDMAIWQYVAQQVQIDPDQLRQLQSDFWAGDELNTSLLEFVQSLRPHWKTGILSNAWSEMRDLNVQRFGLTDVVDVADYSFQIGILKPDPRAFQAVLDHLGVAAEQSVFVDDYMHNIDGARACGMQAIQFQNNAQVISDLRILLGL